MQLKNPKWEAFAQALARLESADSAYQSAGYSENRGNAIRLKANERIQARVAELGKASESATTLTVRRRREICAAIAEDVTQDGSVRIAATIAEAKHAQEFMEKSETRDTTPKEPLDVLIARFEKSNAARAAHGRQ